MKTPTDNPRRYSLKTFRTTFVTEAGAPDPRLSNSRDVVNIVRDILGQLDANQEHFILLALNTKNRVYGFKVIHSGGMAQSIVDARLVMGAALKLEAASMIIAHNHPSGEPNPSMEDRGVTARLMSASKIMGIKFLDHVIIGDEDYFSFSDAGLLEPESL